MIHLEGGWLEWEHTGWWQGQYKPGLVRQAGSKLSPELNSSKTCSIMHWHTEDSVDNTLNSTVSFFNSSQQIWIQSYGSASNICLIIWVFKYPENRSGEWIYRCFLRLFWLFAFVGAELVSLRVSNFQKPLPKNSSSHPEKHHSKAEKKAEKAEKLKHDMTLIMPWISH